MLSVQTTDATSDSIPVARDFPNLFLKELLGNLIDREIEFVIDVISGTKPISKAPYRMSTAEIK